MILVQNKNAFREFEIAKKYEAGIVLTGPEVKSLRNKSASLKGSYVKIIGLEAFLLNAHITPYSFADNREYDPTRTRKLLLKKKEIYQLQEADQKKGWTVVPLAVLLQGRHLKLELGLGRGKKVYEQRQELKKKAQERDVQREFKEKIRLR